MLLQKGAQNNATAIVLYLLKKESQQNEVCFGHKVRSLCLLDGGYVHNYLWYIKYQLTLSTCPKDERESLKKLKTSPGIHKSFFTTQ